MYPTTIEVPTLVDLLKLANEKLIRFLQPFELRDTPLIYVRLGETIISPNDANTETMNWDVEYAWFYVEPSDGGGSDAYFQKVNEDTIDIWDDYAEYGDIYIEVKKSLSVGHYWVFRRSTGQPAIINLVYGIIASALAELTKGYIFSDDGAWHGGPIRPTVFDSQYFVPSKARSFDDASWYESCLEDIVSGYNGKPIELHYHLFEWHELSFEQRLVYYPSGRLFREGPAKEDRLFIMLSCYDKLPYLFINHMMISATEEFLTRQMSLIDIKYGFRLLNNPIVKVLEEYEKLKIALDHHDTIFWTNPLCIKDGEEIRRQIT
ncbi:hypothetical protein ACFO9Q_04305 [Paenibacillus sp. GCM10023252]|uniref:hypothetical protein n=1 Tax=Paenibacillus sp. GCM10023252 TaxID=3252649 RepID=UPI003606749F